MKDKVNPLRARIAFSGGEMKVLCECGHPQVLHMGPAGECHARVNLTDLGEGWTARCHCLGFVFDDSVFAKRADLA